MEIRVRNVNDAVAEGLWRMKTSGIREESRNGAVLVLPEPLLTTYEHPTERVLFWPERDANPIFHLMESLWMLAGRDDVRFVEYFNSRMRGFSDDGVTLNGAYGHRWRHRFGVDQLRLLIEHLIAEPYTRRAVLTMWGPQEDLLKVGVSSDVCCNTQAFFDRRAGRLNMTVLNRSNDLIWGAYGANAVHFSMLQEFIAAAIGDAVGEYRQFSNNMHLYTELYDYGKYVDVPPDPESYDAYRRGVCPYPLLQGATWQGWLEDCSYFCQHPWDMQAEYSAPFFSEVARPMACVARVRKDKTSDGQHWAGKIQAGDWRLAVMQWIERREHARKN